MVVSQCLLLSFPFANVCICVHMSPFIYTTYTLPLETHNKKFGGRNFLYSFITLELIRGGGEVGLGFEEENTVMGSCKVNSACADTQEAVAVWGWHGGL